jgi:hypothetical protein
VGVLQKGSRRVEFSADNRWAPHKRVNFQETIGREHKYGTITEGRFLGHNRWAPHKNKQLGEFTGGKR